uniref:BZIP domain-containing protein n=1 Tax=Syphacia muris TaxID=451379 RepID=A0A0N5AB39_9BILA
MFSIEYDLKSDMYLPYPPAMTTTVMTPNFSQYNVPATQNLETLKDDSYSSESNCSRSKSVASAENFQMPRTSTYQQKSDSSFEDESRRKYRERRDKNNMAAKRSRLNRKEREQRMARQVAELERENAELRQQLAVYIQQLDILKKQCEQSFTPFTTYSALGTPSILRENSNNILPQQQQQQQQQQSHFMLLAEAEVSGTKFLKSPLSVVLAMCTSSEYFLLFILFPLVLFHRLQCFFPSSSVFQFPIPNSDLGH